MEEPSVSGLFEKLCTAFPCVPKHIIQDCVNQNHDEQTCIQALEEISSLSPDNEGQNYIYPNYELPVLQFANLNLQNIFATEDSDVAPSTSSSDAGPSTNNSDASMSSPGIIWDTSTTCQAQTAPVSSNNPQGFNFAVLIPCSGSTFYSVNNSIYQTPGMENRLQVPAEIGSRSSSPNSTNSNVSDLPRRANSPRVSYMLANLSAFPNSHLNSPPNNIPSGSRSFISQLSAPSNISNQPVNANTEQSNHPQRSLNGYPTIRRGDPIVVPQYVQPQFTFHPINPEVRPPVSPERPDQSNSPDINSPLHINVGNNPDIHDWIPMQQFSLSPSYPVPVELRGNQPLPGYQVRLVAANAMGVHTYQRRNQVGPQHRHINRADFVIDDLPIVRHSYAERHLALQKQRLNSLKYEMENARILYANLQKDVEDQQLYERTSQQNEHDITCLKQSIESLRSECSVLCAEVDKYSTDQVSVPLGETTYAFYNCLNTGQQGPPRTDSATNKSDADIVNQNSAEDEGVGGWKCGRCTFVNHPEISVCEMCIEPRTISRGYSKKRRHVAANLFKNKKWESPYRKGS